MWESIPGSMLQTYAIIKRFEDREWVQIASLLSSALSVGAISSRMSYYVDISSTSREFAGDFYGFVPDHLIGRSIIAVAMMMLAVSQLLARALAYGLISVSIGKRYSVVAVVLEASSFFLYKLIRKDFYYQGFAELKGIVRFIGTFFERFTVKIIADFTCLMQLRNPNEMGGL
jgi:hypothetical protein